MSKISYIMQSGYPYPLGLSANGRGINFSVVSTWAKEVVLCLFDRNTKEMLAHIPLSPQLNKSGNIWHILLENLQENNRALTYAYQLAPSFKHDNGFLLDPYAKNLATSHVWGQTQSEYHPMADILISPSFNWENVSSPGHPLDQLVIYEMHVRGFTQHPSSQVTHPGTFLGVIEKIPYLLDLGINAIELLPTQEFNENEYQLQRPQQKKELFNYWGYSTVNFFSPMNRFASQAEPGTAVREFKMMVRELHRHGIEVILDVVFNHTAEGDEKGPILSFKGFDNAIYYIINHGKYLNASGCGNTVNANHPITLNLIMEALRYWVSEMHVDGFRFDLASALTRGAHGEPLNLAPIIQAISCDPLLAHVKLIAEPWDLGLYHVGNFAPETKRWSEWNGKYRDAVRRFIKGDHGTNGEFAMRLCGSEDLYRTRGPQSSINYITAHDGFTLADLVSYNYKHNFFNGENNQDGSNDNYSWNCGVEGATNDPKIKQLRAQQMRNFYLTLMLSKGVPMLHMGDEYAHTKQGNNNTWCQDNELNWFLWNQQQDNQALYRFFKTLIKFRKNRPHLFGRHSFLHHQDIDWHGCHPFKPVWNQQPFLAFTLNDLHAGKPLYAAFNAQNQSAELYLPSPPSGKQWRWVVNSSHEPPQDIFEEGRGPILEEAVYTLPAFAAILLETN